jgi:hypothetical protein
MPVRKVEVERFSLTTSRPFDSVVSALKTGIGQLDLAAFASASKSSGTFAELEEVINRNMGETGLMLFLEFDHDVGNSFSMALNTSGDSNLCPRECVRPM